MKKLFTFVIQKKSEFFFISNLINWFHLCLYSQTSQVVTGRIHIDITPRICCLHSTLDYISISRPGYAVCQDMLSARICCLPGYAVCTQHWTAVHDTTQHSKMLHITAPHCTIQKNTQKSHYCTRLNRPIHRCI